MPITRYEDGDLLEKFEAGEFKAIVHGCNCFHTMGAGIAGQIAKRFPKALHIDRHHSEYGSIDKLGQFTSVNIPNVGDIINAYTQWQPGMEDPYRLYHSIKKVFSSINAQYGVAHILYGANRPVIGIPKIGCGIAGGDWEVVSRMIDDNTPDLNIVVVEYVRKS